MPGLSHRWLAAAMRLWRPYYQPYPIHGVANAANGWLAAAMRGWLQRGL